VAERAMSESDRPGATELKELMSRVLDSDAAEAFGDFMVRRMALGDMVTARFSDNDIEVIGCGTRMWTTGTPTFRWGFCQVRDAANVNQLCFTENPDLLDMMKSTADYSFITFAWDADGECTHVGFSTQSFYIPDFRDQGSSPGSHAPGRGR
jgi:hypothetical protein